ncbi:MAG: histidinol-phosphate transaminase [Gemmatimonadaceae bacterium]
MTSRPALFASRLPGVSLYATDETPCDLDLSDNTNLWGMPPVAASLAAARAVAASRYPTPYGGDLKIALASYLGVDASMVVTGCGSDDVLDSAIRALAGPDDVIAFPTPTFSMIPVFATVSGLALAPILLNDDYTIDVDALLATRARITYLCSPNNPTSTAIAYADVERIVAESYGVVILDEAYAEFSGVSHTALLARSERLVITRTMSKAFGLAGLRVGYGAASPVLAMEIEKARGPYKVNAVAERAAVAVLGGRLEDGESQIASPRSRADPWVDETVREAVEHRERLSAELRAREFAVAPSAANFLFVPDAGAVAVAAALRARSIAVRAFDALPVFGPALRITVGPWPMMERLLAALDEIRP